MKGKLRNKIFFFMVLVSVVPVVVAGVSSVYSINLSHRIDVANLEEALINKTAAEMETLLGTVFENRVNIKLDLDSAEIERRGLTLANIGDLFFPGLLKESLLEPISEISFLNLEGQEAVRHSRFYPGFKVPKEDLRDESALKKFTVPLGGEKYVGDVYFTLSGPMVTLAAPLSTRDGVLFGVTTAEVSLERARGIAGEAKLGESGYVYLVDREGFLIGGGGPFEGTKEGTDLKEARIISELAERAKAAGPGWKVSAALEKGKEAVAAGRDFLGAEGQRRYRSFFGQEVVAAARFLPDYGLGLVAEWPVAEADASINKLIWGSATTSIAVFAAAVLASILLATLIVKPVRALERGTEKVAQGKFDEKIQIKTGDELEELGEAFNKMIGGLKRLEELKEEFILGLV